ncbi:DHA2 family efflux MFS transporter permease subunit [Cryobacterium algoritolerans]|uniref:DHA2 family efflux MFS transporter permease subunit n=1 Tax=Cryobacterium algoritolerans TaxID=1259184 RepID=A0A4R8WLS5_9MICO|nr:MFS transporter [Cryobacterium algoritolerans]TFC11873.1 DHA2 family efflux MFS transporter permease subunit [Cryobacterium algoritolerans]
MPQTSSDSSSLLAALSAPSRRWWTLSVVALAQLMVVLDSTVVNIALPSAQADLGFSNGDRQWIVTAYSLAFGSLLLLGGRLSDLIGRKRTFIIGLVGFAAASALGGAAGSFGMLVAARALQGAFGALLAPTALAVLTTTFIVPKERARAFGVFGAIAGAGGAIGLLLGGYLTETFDWRWNLYINVVIAVVAVIGAVTFVSNANRTGPRPKLDIPGTLLVSGSLFGLVYGFSNAEIDGWDSPLTWGMLVAAAVLLVGFVLWQRKAEHPLLPLSIVLDRNRGAAYSSVLIAGAGMFGIFLFVTYFLQTSLGYTPIQTGLSFLPMIAMLVLAAQLSTNIFVPRFGPKVMVPFGMALGATGMAYLTHLGLDSSYAADILPPLMILGFGMGSIMPASMQTATLGVDRQFAGVASAMVNTSQQVGGSIGTALLNTLAATAATDYLAAHLPVSAAVAAQAAVHSYATAYWWGAGFFLFGGVLAALLFRRLGHGTSLANPHGTPSSTEAEPVLTVRK